MAPSVAFSSPPSNGPVRIHPKPPSLQQTRRASPTRPPGIIMYNNAIHISNDSINDRTLATINTDCITHIFYSSAKLSDDGTVYLDEIDTDKPVAGAQGCLGACAGLRQKNSILKVLLSIGDNSHGTSDAFRKTAANEPCRKKCAWTARELVESYELDGIDIAWDNINTSTDANNYILLLSDMREIFPEGRFVVSSSISYNTYVDFKPAAYYMDLINLKCFDFAGPMWSPVVSHTSQTYSPVGSTLSNGGLSCYSAIENLTRQGVPPSKIMLGIPAFGWGYLEASRLGENYSSKKGKGRKILYSELPRPNTWMECDDDAKACYSRGGDAGFVSYDCPWSVQFKAELVKENRLAGLVTWEATGDHKDHRRSIVAAGWQNLLPDGVREE